jgi:5-methyltetrahydrofolate--homocysteine methyltransferase
VLNTTFLAMAIASGLTSAITNPLEESIRQTILACDVMMAHDPNCAAWLTAQRPAPAAGDDRAARRERRRQDRAGS